MNIPDDSDNPPTPESQVSHDKARQVEPKGTKTHRTKTIGIIIAVVIAVLLCLLAIPISISGRTTISLSGSGPEINHEISKTTPQGISSSKVLSAIKTLGMTPDTISLNDPLLLNRHPSYGPVHAVLGSYSPNAITYILGEVTVVDVAWEFDNQDHLNHLAVRKHISSSMLSAFDRAGDLRSDINKIAIGMPKAQVLAQLGQPQHEDDDYENVLIYQNPDGTKKLYVFFAFSNNTLCGWGVFKQDPNGVSMESEGKKWNLVLGKGWEESGNGARSSLEVH